ncbi:MAG: DNA alkylation repair protein [Cytophagales bacterium]|nr:DNA alkylation repair protein [Cytophagales bacterium]
MKTLTQILKDLDELANPEYVSTMEHFGIKGGKALGIKNAVLKPYAKEIGRNQDLACELWDEPFHEAKLLAIWLSEPKKFTEEIAEKWVSESYSWDLIDAMGMKILPKTAYSEKKVLEWSIREAEFEKRMAFATIVGITIHNKKESDETRINFLPLIEREAWDDRNFVKKAVNWALRTIGKRSLYLNKLAITSAERIQKQDSKSAKWIASDALRELKGEKVQERLKAK